MTDQQHDDWTFPFCPQPPDWSLDWQGIETEFECVRAMDGCDQDPVWHGEGDVLVHTRMVCEALIQMQAWRELPPQDRAALFAAALMHDVAKPVVQREEDGRIRAPRHASKGARMTRSLLWRHYLPPRSLEHTRLREEIVGLVRRHGLPLYLLDEANPGRAVIGASQTVRLDRVAMLAEADARGRECADQAELLDRVDLFREIARENGCYTSARAFASDHGRYLYFQGRDLDPDCEVYDDTRLEVVVTSGLPAAGKDYWIARHAADLPVVSLDAIREELGIRPEADQGAVVARAKEQARAHLRVATPFVWNATNVTRPMRSQLFTLLHDYCARIRIVYTETTWDELLRRNRARSNRVPEAVLVKLAGKLDVPDLTEAHGLEWSVS